MFTSSHALACCYRLSHTHALQNPCIGRFLLCAFAITSVIVSSCSVIIIFATGVCFSVRVFGSLHVTFAWTFVNIIVISQMCDDHSFWWTWLSFHTNWRLYIPPSHSMACWCAALCSHTHSPHWLYTRRIPLLNALTSVIVSSCSVVYHFRNWIWISHAVYLCHTFAALAHSYTLILYRLLFATDILATHTYYYDWII